MHFNQDSPVKSSINRSVISENNKSNIIYSNVVMNSNVNNSDNNNKVLYNDNYKNKQCQLLNVFHQNIQGLRCKELEIVLFLEKINIDIMCITEHWLKDDINIVNFPCHKIVSSFTRESFKCGGSLILAKNDIKCKERRDIVALSIERTIEVACVELEQHIVTSVYRPPSGTFDTFESVMENILDILTKSRKKIIVCGDFNINILEENIISNRFLCLFKSSNLTNLFSVPTRITTNTATCLDNIFTDYDPLKCNLTNLLNSDHFGISATFVRYISQNNQIEKKYIRPLNAHRVERFRHEVATNLSKLPFPIIRNPNNLYESLFTFLQTQFNNIFKRKIVDSNLTPQFCDWATPGIYKSRSYLYELYDRKSYTHDATFHNYVKTYSKIFKKACLTAKSLYISSKIHNSTDKVKTVWKIIKSETGKNSLPNKNIKLTNNDKLIEKDHDIANIFEQHFSDIPNQITSSLTSSPEMAKTLLRTNVKKCIKSFNFSTVNSNDIIKTFKTLDLKKTEDTWGLSTIVLSSIINEISPHLALIFNESIDKCVFPDLMKVSKVLPLFKSGERSDPNNYRPISILPTFSKIFEKIMLMQMQDHFVKHKLFHPKQFGFSKGHSTIDAGVCLVQHIFHAWEQRHDALGVFCDLSKAFDCVSHATLLLKLEHYGVRYKALDFLSSYLNKRTQKIHINEEISSGASITMGIPQGSILGPFLFLVYINDLPYMINDYEIVLFADDTSFIFKLDRKQNETTHINMSLKRVNEWFAANNLLLNVNKTKCVKFCLPNVKTIDINIVLNEKNIEIANSTTFLGILLDSKLHWGSHIKKLNKRLSSAAYAVKKIRQFTNLETARMVYFSYFHSLLTYGILLWGNSADVESVFILQKRAVRGMCKLSYCHSLRQVFKDIKILTVASQFIYENIMYVYKNINMFTKNSDHHSFNTRIKDKLQCSNSRLNKVHRSFVGQSTIYFNKIPHDLTRLPLQTFKHIIKNKLIKKGYYSIKEYLNDKDAWS